VAWQPLQGVRVVDLTQILSGPFATQILADLGAEVVKVEPPAGDKARHNGPMVNGKSSYFASLNRGKRSVCLDLKAEGGRRALLALAGAADVLVENFRPGVMARLGLGYERLREANPRLVYAACSGFGQEGARAQKPALDVVVQAMAGTMALTGDEAPVRAGFSAGDIAAGLYLAVGVLAALHGRAATGRGVFLDVAMLDCQVAVLENAFARYFATGDEPRRLGSRHPVMAPFQAFSTADRPLVVAVSSDAHWRGFCRALGHPEWAEDGRFQTSGERIQNLPALEAMVAPVLRADGADAWLERLSRAQVPCGPIRAVSEVAADPALGERGLFASVDYDGVPFRVVASPLLADGERPAAARVPALGADTGAVLGAWARDVGDRGEAS
jgi:CoA:oxalate CoA-transferase